MLLISSVTTWSFAALGDIADDRKIVTSKAYVDTKQVKIPATTNTYTYDETNRPTADGSVVTTGASDGTVGERGIATAPTYDANDNLTNDSWLPTMGAMMNAIDSHTPTGTRNTIANYDANGALGSGIATYDGSGTYAPATDAGKIATAAAVETKQDKIVTSDILLLEEDGDGIPNDIYAPSIVTHDSNDETLVGTQFGILSNSVIDDADIGWKPPYLYDFANRDDLVPTVAALTPMFDELWDNFNNYGAQWETLNWTGSTGTNGQIGFINNYSSGFSSGGLKAGWPTETQDDLVNHKFLVNALALKQNKIASSGYYYNALTGAITSYNENTSRDTGSWLNTAVKGTGLVTKTTTNGVVGERKIFEESDVANYHADGLNKNQMNIQDISIPTVGAVKSMLASKQNTVTTGLVEFYDGGNDPSAAVNVPALVATDSTGTELNGNTIGIVRRTDIPEGDIFLYTPARHDNFVPSLRLMASELNYHTRRIYDTDAGDNLSTISSILAAVNAYSIGFDSGTNNWPSVTQNRLVNGETLAWTLAMKQNKIGATSNGVNNTPNYVYNATTNPTADGSVVTTTTTVGTVGQRGIATAPVSDGNGGYSNGDWLPTVNAMMNAISSATPTISGTQNTIANYDANGALGSGIATYDGSGTYAPATDAGKLATAAAVETKQNKIGATSDGSNSTPNYVYNATTNPTADGSVVTTGATAGTVGQRGIAKAPVSDGNGGYSNGDWLPTVDAMMNAISSATPTISGTQNTIANYDANGALGSGIATYDGSGTYAPATDAGKIATAAAVETKQDKIIAGTAGNVVTYTGTAGSVGSATVSSAATYSNDTLQNGNDIANITAVETKVSKTQSTGYQVLTTGTNGTVTADYISVPVTTSGTGRPTSTNAPTGTAAIWIE